MASGTQTIPKSGWSDREVIHTETYGNLVGFTNPYLGVALIYWAGNANTPPNEQIDISIPDKYKSKDYFSILLRNGDMMEIRVDTVRLRLTGTAWSSGTLMYVLQ